MWNNGKSTRYLHIGTINDHVLIDFAISFSSTVSLLSLRKLKVMELYMFYVKKILLIE